MELVCILVTLVAMVKRGDVCVISVRVYRSSSVLDPHWETFFLKKKGLSVWSLHVLPVPQGFPVQDPFKKYAEIMITIAEREWNWRG